MTNLTDNETAVLRSLANNHYGEMGDGVWSDCVNDSTTPSGIEGHALAGVIGSLCKKGLIKSEEYDPNAWVIWMQQAGRDAIKTLNLVEG